MFLSLSVVFKDQYIEIRMPITAMRKLDKPIDALNISFDVSVFAAISRLCSVVIKQYKKLTNGNNDTMMTNIR